MEKVVILNKDILAKAIVKMLREEDMNTHTWEKRK